MISPGFAVILIALAAYAPAASAAEFKAGAYPATVTGSQLAADRVQIFFGSPSLLCETVTISGTLAAASGSLTAHPVFGTCEAFGFKEASVTTTGCDFRFNVGALAGSNIWEGTLDVVCSAGNAIKVTAGTCAAEIKSVNGLAEVDLSNQPQSIPQDMTFKFLLANVPYTVTKDGLLCPFTATGNFTDGGGAGRMTVTATSGGATSFFIG